ncbi:MAG TPA: carboxypeptidase regulatory-like domain-containing protein [Blastocatellia bacterium]|nr:carboxypeptidase regulatory-like domain-containing protein [Blastocatellia bacterium]
MRRRNLFLALALVLLPATVCAQGNMVRGKVRASNGTSLNNAIVELRQSGGGMIGQTVTRNDGNYAFSNLTPGEYEVVVLLAGFEPGLQIARFNYGERMGFWEVVTVDVVLYPKPEAALGPPGTSFVQEVPKPARAAYEKAMAKVREGKSDEAVLLLQEAISIFNEYFDANFSLGRELFRMGKDAEALEALERARQINDREGAVYHTFGLVMMKQQKFAVAEYAFREATRLAAGNAVSHYFRGMALIEVATRTADERQRAIDFTEAEKELGRALDLSDKRLAAAYLQRARIHERRGDKEAAARDLESYLKAEPEAKNAAAIREAITKLRGPKK